jgi:hypothetical protein
MTCFLLALPLLSIHLCGRSSCFHHSFGEVFYARLYGWPTVHARRWECFQLGSRTPLEISPLLGLSAGAATLNFTLSVIVLASAFVTVESVRRHGKRLQFSLRTLLTFLSVVAGICGFLVLNRRFESFHDYVPLTGLPIYLSVPLLAGIAAVVHATVMGITAIGNWALGLARHRQE